jgi:hypothetical protein
LFWLINYVASHHLAVLRYNQVKINFIELFTILLQLQILKLRVYLKN